MIATSNTIQRTTLYLFSASHALLDFFSGVWVLVLAGQKTALDLSYAQVGLAQAVYTLVSAVAQPFLGTLFDRTGKPYLAIWSVASIALMVALAALANTFALVVLAGSIAGLSSAVFHATGLSGAKQLAAGRGAGRATAVFLLGGNGGLALGAYTGGVIIDRYGLSWITVPAFIVIGIAPFLVRMLQPYLDGLQNVPERSTREFLLGGRTVWLPIIAFTLVVTTNQAFQGAYSTYLPQLLEEQGNSLEYAGRFTTIFLWFSALGSFMGGSLSDRVSRRALAIGSMVAITPLSLAALRAEDSLSLGILNTFLGLATNMSLPIMLLIGQEVLPGGRSAASGYAYGITFLTRALAMPLIGEWADRMNLLDTLLLISWLPLTTAALMFFLPAHPRERPPL